ncbi:hypothetical protein [Kitasatospora sp. NPDC056184]|uniref:hypothetical protein n=1 Tax=Kitasatospora sp. NPDC056184 TaxID=3345738 RepID=UPI0035E0E3BF
MADRQDDPQTVPDDPADDVEPVDPFGWLRAHRWPPERPAEPRPILTPEEHAEVPLTAEERQRRAVLLARVREANHPRR